jgi:hypothetical protein
MDPAGVGALIGITIMICGLACSTFYNRRERIRKLFTINPSDHHKETTKLLYHPVHVKMKDILPPLKVKTIFLNSL